jgi:hypothetical protein
MSEEPHDEGAFPESREERLRRWLIPTRVDSRNDTCAKMASVVLCAEPFVVLIAASLLDLVIVRSRAESFYDGASLIVIGVLFLSIGLRGVMSGVDLPAASWLLVGLNVCLILFGVITVWDAVLQVTGF